MGKRSDPNELLTTPEAAKILGVTRQWVRQLCNDRRLPAIKAGRDYLLRRADVEAYKPAPVGRPKTNPPS